MTPTSRLMNSASSENPFFNVMPATPFQAGNQTQWGPDSIGTIVFGVIMCILGLIALWQGRQKAKSREHDLEQGPTGEDLGERIANAPDPISMIQIPPEIGSEGIRPLDGEEQRRKQSSIVEVNEYPSKEEDKEEGGGEVQIGQLQGDENEVGEEFEPKRGKTTRTDTDWTLVGSDDEDEAKGKKDDDWALTYLATKIYKFEKLILNHEVITGNN